jgi:branched-chain amino acid transport system ATP-binding protein
MLDVSDLVVAYGGQQVIHGVSFSAQPSQIVSLIGANGAGKTSTLRAIIGLTRSKSGRIMFSGQDIARLPCTEIVGRGIALSPEGRRVFADMTVHENLMIGAYLQSDRKAIAEGVERMFAYFPRLRERRMQLAGSLSGGEQQMLAIGRALMARPKLLLLDEPSLGLAPLIVKEIARIMQEICQAESMSIILVEQNASMALKLCEHAYVLETGRITASGSGRELLASDYIRKAYLGI